MKENLKNGAKFKFDFSIDQLKEVLHSNDTCPNIRRILLEALFENRKRKLKDHSRKNPNTFIELYAAGLFMTLFYPFFIIFIFLAMMVFIEPSEKKSEGIYIILTCAFFIALSPYLSTKLFTEDHFERDFNDLKQQFQLNFKNLCSTKGIKQYTAVDHEIIGYCCQISQIFPQHLFGPKMLEWMRLETQGIFSNHPPHQGEISTNTVAKLFKSGQ